MKKIMVFSDSHGYLENMITAIETHSPDMVIHLGDCYADGQTLKRIFPELTIEQVPGNCDYHEEALERILIIEGKRILICHGHTYHVKSGYLNIQYAALEKQADAVLFGHTHQAHYGCHNGLVMLNPGTVGYTVMKEASYGWLYIDSENDKISVQVEFLE